MSHLHQRPSVHRSLKHPLSAIMSHSSGNTTLPWSGVLMQPSNPAAIASRIASVDGLP